MLSLSSHRFLIVLFVAALAFGSTTPVHADDETPANTNDCLTDSSFQPDIGYACMTASGLYHMFTVDGEDLGYTHGPDPIPTEPEEEVVVATDRAPVCTDDDENGYYGLLIYARAHDDDDRYAQKAPDILYYFQQANQKLYDAAREHGATRDYVMHCTDGAPTVMEAVLPTDKANAGPGSIFSEIRSMGFNSARVKYWVWYDDPGACGCGGIGNVYNDDRGYAANLNNGNGGSMVGITFGYNSWSVMMHENGHNNGAVQLSALMSSGGFHCNDGQDVMCYGDGALKSVYIPVVCFQTKWDCNGDDYFNPNPMANTYLTNHWNLGAQYNRYMVGDDDVPADPMELPSVPCLGTLRLLGLCG